MWAVFCGLCFIFFSTRNQFSKMDTFPLEPYVKCRRICACMEPFQIESDIHPAINLKALNTKFLPDSFHIVTQYFCKWNMPFRVSDYNYKRAACPVHLIILRACSEEYKIWSSPLCRFLNRLITLSLLCPDIILCDRCNILNIIQDVSSRPACIRCYCTDLLLCETINAIIVALFYVILFCAERVTST